MSKTKNVGVFGVLLFGVMMLLIPATSIANAQEYDRYYQEKDRYSNDYGYEKDRYYDEYRQNDYRNSYGNEYKKVDKKSEKYPIIIENKIPVPHKVKEKKKELPMLTVNKEVLFCDLVANGTNNVCGEPPSWPGPNSDRWVQQCSSDDCEGIDESSFEIKVEQANVFEGSEKGTKLNFGVPFNVIEQRSEGADAFLKEEESGILLEAEFLCEEIAGFEGSFVDFIDIDSGDVFISCVLFEGDCSGTILNGEHKECTVKNHIAALVPLL